MQYFIPFWPGDDIYEEFDPWKDECKGRQKRIWEYFKNPPIDGVLVSRVNIDQTNHLKKKAEKEGIHEALRFNGPVMGDCGAFSYVNDPDPKYKPIPTLKFYKDLGFDIGVTVDHLIVKTIKTLDKTRRALTDAEKEERWNLTIENAKRMFDEAQKSQYEKLRLIGVSQGWDAESYARGIRELLDYGFDYVGLGGLARKPNQFVREVLLRVHREIKEHVKKTKLGVNVSPRIGVHLFGVARTDLLETMVQCGITSFDSASPLRMAWMSSNKNYMMNDHFYAAVRVRIAKTEEEKAKEERVFGKLIDFWKGLISANEFVEELSCYKPGNHAQWKEDALRTFVDRPWEKCDCPICTEIGMHVCIFRGCERNMRRGFHNVYQFHKVLRERFPRVLVLTWCTGKKDPEEKLLPAYRRYLASNIFKTFWENVYDLPVEIGVLSAKYMLINWDTRIPMYEERLTTHKLPEAIKDVESKLRFYDKVYFIGLGIYREAVEKASKNMNIPIEVYPKQELSRGKLDIIEYNRQMKEFREAIRKEIASYLEAICAFKQTELNAF
jgi:hypothetical protein